MAVSIRYPGMQQGYDPQAVDQSFDRAFTYGRERRDEKQGLAAFDKYITGLSGGQPAQQQPMSIAALAPQGYPGEVERAPLPDIASGRVAQAHSGAQSPWPGAAPKQDRITPQDAARASGPPQGAIEAYIRHAAQKRGIDPEIALKVAMSEGGVSDPTRQSDVVKNGVREQSYGPFQLYMNGGLGNEALAAGIDPRKDWQGGIDFALDKAAQGGWGPWYGAEKVGVTGRMGIGGGQQPMQVADASGGTPAPQGGPSGGSGLPDRETMLALFKSPQTRPLAIQLAQAAQAAKQGDPEGALKLEKLRLEVEQMRSGGGSEYGLTPVYGKNKDGRIVLGQLSKDGTFRETALPEGFDLAPGTDRIDLGTAWGITNRAGEVIDTIPKDLAGAEAQKVIGKTAGEQTASAEGSVQAAQNSLDLIKSIRDDPARTRGTGFSSVFNSVPASQGYGFQKKVEQAKSGAFLTAIQQLQGFGALSNSEGQTATAAVTRMDTAMNEADFLAALDDYEKLVQQGLDRAKSKMGGGQAPAPQGGGNPYKDKYGLD